MRLSNRELNGNSGKGWRFTCTQKRQRDREMQGHIDTYHRKEDLNAFFQGCN